jgi:phosphatidylethanolamine/phosphatidyl-N-methylethanolamine N-methyltransferase
VLNHIRLTRALLRNPKAVGALAPSSRYLASYMAGLLPVNSKLVVEFGGGTGPVTRAMLDCGFSPENLYVFELSAQLCKHLRRAFPGVNIIHASASEIIHLDNEVCAVISSLPLRSLPDSSVAEILEATRKKLRPGGHFVQFTYDLMRHHALFNTGFRHLDKKIVWANLPPARIDIFQKT